MTKIAARRMVSSSRTMSGAWSSTPRLLRTRIGTTNSLQTITASASAATITIAVAADRPPMKAIMVTASAPASSGQAQHEGVGVDGGAVAHQAGHGDRHDEDVDGDQIGREHPARRGQLGRGVVLDDGDVEHPRQQNHREERQQRHHDPIAARQSARQHVGADRIAHHRIEEIGGAGEEDEDDIDADGG